LRLIALLRETRIAGRWTQRDIAKRLGKPPSYVHKGEVGSRRLDFREVVEWCAALDLEVGAAVKAVRR
jgi:transcriptional regulator with XRE-family HTH domain